MLLTAFIVLGFLLLILAVSLLPLSFRAAAIFDECGFSLNLRVVLAYLVTVFGWDSKEEGFDFLVKKRVKKEKKKKKRISRIIEKIYNPGALLHIKGLTVARFEVQGVIATADAAETAILYGLTCAFVSTIIPHLRRSRVLVDFCPDFQQKKPDFHISCIIRIRIIHIIYLIASLYIDEYLKGRWHGLWNRILSRSS